MQTTVYSDADKDPFEFPQCRWKVDDGSNLHIYRPPTRGQEKASTPVAVFAAGRWSMVTDGRVTER